MIIHRGIAVSLGGIAGVSVIFRAFAAFSGFSDRTVRDAS